MSNQSDLDYYASRARAERELSVNATDPAVATIHAKLADRYEKLAGELAAPRAILRIVTA
jgi:hypothetical protein